MASVHFTKYNYKWFIHSEGRASVTVVQATCPLLGLMSLIQSPVRGWKQLASASAFEFLSPPQTFYIKRTVWPSWDTQYGFVHKNCTPVETPELKLLVCIDRSEWREVYWKWFLGILQTLFLNSNYWFMKTTLYMDPTYTYKVLYIFFFFYCCILRALKILHKRS